MLGHGWSLSSQANCRLETIIFPQLSLTQGGFSARADMARIGPLES
jgi:hypothetical protein